MIPHRVMGLDDYLAMGRRRWRLVAVTAAVPPILGFLISFAFPPTYTSSSLIQVERPAVLPSGIVKAPMTPTFLQISYRELGERRDRMIALQQQVLSRSNVQAIVRRLGMAKKGKSEDAVIDEILANASITEADLNPVLGTSVVPYVFSTPGFSETFTADNPHDAQQICSELTSSLLTEDSKAREQATEDTTDLIARQLNEARSNLDEQDKKLALFKGQHLGQLPENLDDNLKVLAGLNTQLEGSNQALVRAEQDKAYEESILARETAAWKASQLNMTSDTIEQRLATLKAEFAALQARYTENHPEVIKMKNDIASLEGTLKKMDASTNRDEGSDNVANKAEPQVVLQLRQQVHQDDDVIEKAKREQKGLRAMISNYQSKLTLSPEVEKEYNQLTRDNQIAHTIYEGLLTSKSESEIHADMERHRQGEKLRLLNPANLPTSPSFPERWKFAAYGLGGGVALGLCTALWLEFRDKAIRNEADVMAAVDLPMLTSIPWVGTVAPIDGGAARFKVGLGHKGTA